MSLPSDLCWRFLWRQAAILLLVVAIGSPIFWGMGLLGTATLPGFVWGCVLTSALGMLVVGIQAWRTGRALTEIHAALSAFEKREEELALTGNSHNVFPDIASVLERVDRATQQDFAQLAGQLNRMQSVINSMAEGVIGVDDKQNILLMNVAACEIFSLREGAALGRPVWEQVRYKQLQNWVAEAINSGHSSGGEMRPWGKVTRDLACRVSAFQGQDLTGAVIVVTDVTELRRLEQVRQQFVANASHELKTPISSIQACIETLMDGAVDDPQCRDRFLQTICEQSERLDALVQDLLMLARLESEPLNREPRPVWIEGLMRICYERHLQTAERKGITLILKSIPPDLRVQAEEDALEHILDNLVDNALKYTERGGQVTLSVQVDQQTAAIEIADTGIGIPQQHLPRIFERFYRVDRHRSRDVGGTGLGLSIVKHLVQAIGGSVAVTSRLQQGSTFAVRFPLSQPGD